MSQLWLKKEWDGRDLRASIVTEQKAETRPDHAREDWCMLDRLPDFIKLFTGHSADYPTAPRLYPPLPMSKMLALR